MKTIPTWMRGCYEIDTESGCWLWTGAKFSTGYAMVRLSGVPSPLLGHRLSYEALVGPLVDGLQIDHVYAVGCRHKHCIRPDHLEQVTPKVNTLRYHRSIDTCPYGHLRSTEFYMDPAGKRHCRQCRRDAQQRYGQRYPERKAARLREWRARQKSHA
jgi:hypothetical protein